MHAALDFKQLASQFNGDGIRAVILLGSHARGDAGPFSDVDLVRLLAKDAAERPDDGSHLFDGALVVVSSVGPAKVEEWFSEPQVAVTVVAGLRRGIPLIDPENVFAAIRERAAAFEWSADLQDRANRYAGKELVGWIEEMHKGLEGLRRDDVGRLLNARFGGSWGLSHVLQVQRGLLISGDNGFYDEMADALGRESTWVRLRATAYGLPVDAEEPPSLRAQVRAGLKLYVETVRLIGDVLPRKERDMIMQTVNLIEQELPMRSD